MVALWGGGGGGGRLIHPLGSITVSDPPCRADRARTCRRDPRGVVINLVAATNRPLIPVIRRAALATVVAAACFGLPASAQDARPVEEVPANVLTSDNPQVINQTLNGFFNTQVPRLSEDASAVREAKEALVAPMTGDASQTFRDSYCQSLAQAFAPLYGNNGTVLSARLAGAVVVQQVASREPSRRLIDTVEAILKDNRAPVAMWGVKAVRPLATQSTRQNVAGNDALIGGIVEAVKRHDGEGFLAHEAFLVLQDIGGGGFDIGEEVSVVVAERYKPQVVIAVLDLIEHRLTKYGPPASEEVAPTTPSVPLADRPGTLLLANQDVWAQLDLATKSRARLALVSLADKAGEAAAVAQDAQRDTDDEDLKEKLVEQRDELRSLLTSSAQAPHRGCRLRRP